MNPAALKVNELSVHLNANAGVHRLVDNISFSIKAGEVMALVGESGCGKSMTALALMGLLPASRFQVNSGTIELNGKDISVFSQKQMRSVLGSEISMVFQQPGTALDPVFTLGKQITMVARRHLEGNLKTATRHMLDSLASVGFQQPEKVANAYPHQLSGGMRQLAMIAMATVCKPVVLIADEPTTALDNTTQSLILQQFSRLQAEHNTAILLVSHDMSVVKKLSDKILVMYCGRVVESASQEQLFLNARHPYSAGLLSCIPRISHQRTASINTIPGQVPAASDLPAGCHFSPRCRRSQLQCEQAVPALKNDNGQAVACFRPLK